jgi:hypothetical protein
MDLESKDKIATMGFMEEETINLARRKGFQGIFTVNTNPLTQQFGKSVFGYDTLATVQINQYTDTSGKKPFKAALDHYVALAMYKDLS